MTYRELFEEQELKPKENMKIIDKQLSMGKKIEKEHQPTYDYIKSYVEENGKMPPAEEMFKRIALDHLQEIKLYYTGLAEMENKYKKLN